jgi:NADPH-dependent glutamate synthase beta subunit-like oxidoreductase
MIENDIVDNKAVSKEGSEFDLKCSMVISSIGSIPEPIDGIPMEWNTYDIKDEATGEVNGLEHVFGVGNAITGKGNIRVSRNHSREVAAFVAENRLVEDGVDVESVRMKVKELQRKAGYNGNYKAWVAANTRD